MGILYLLYVFHGLAKWIVAEGTPTVNQQKPVESPNMRGRTHLQNAAEGYEHPKPHIVISSAARNLVLQHLNFPFLLHQRFIRKGNIGVEDEISRCARNDNMGFWVPPFDLLFYEQASKHLARTLLGRS
jgi:hypothetical protein